MLLSSALLTIIGACFALGAVDSLIGGKLRLGPVFIETFRKMGSVALGVMGLYSLAPAAAPVVSALFAPLAAALGMEPAAFPALLFPVDMGGWGLCTGMAEDARLGSFFGAVAASIFGATVGYCIPVSSSLIDKTYHADLALGTLCGLVMIPFALFAGGLAAGFEAKVLLWNLLPTLVLSVLLSIGLLRKPALMTAIFTWFGRIMSGVGLICIVLQALRALDVWTPLPALAPLGDASAVVVRITITMSGAMVLVELLRRAFRKPMDALGKKTGTDSGTVAGLLVGTVSALIVYSSFDQYPSRGRVLLAAFCASGAFMLGGQLSVVSSWAPDMVASFLISKCVAGALALPLALLLQMRREKILRAVQTQMVQPES